MKEPNHKVGDEVAFDLERDEENYTIHGKVLIVDRYGTFEQNKEPSYDIIAMAPFCDETILFKHIKESSLI